MSEHDFEDDKAGQEYWNDTWHTNPLPALWDVKSERIGKYVEREMFSYMETAFREMQLFGTGKKLIEVGCARSAVLPLFAKEMGFHVSGLDYSPNGCEQSRQILQREGVSGEIYNCDIFSVPDSLAEQFDVVVSFGLIEHFSDTEAIVAALSKLLKPGGMMFTNIPNMNGMTGAAQKFLAREIYDIHVPLTAEAMRNAHAQAGLKVVSCDYFLSTNFGVVNLNSVRRNTVEWWIKKVILALSARFSMVVWWCERWFGNLPTCRSFSPYVNCIALKLIV